MTLSYYDQSPVSMPAAAAIDEYRTVTVNATGQIVAAGAGVPSIGVTLNRAAAANDMVSVKLWSQGGTFPVTCAKAVTRGTRVFQTADGEVTDTPAGSAISLGVVNEAASGDGAQVEMVADAFSFVPRAIIHTVTAGEGSANQADIVTGLGALLRGVVVQVRTSAGLERAANTITYPTAGTVRVANAALAADDTITIIPIV